MKNQKKEVNKFNYLKGTILAIILALFTIFCLILDNALYTSKLENRIENLEKRTNQLEIQNKLYEYDMQQLNEYHNKWSD